MNGLAHVNLFTHAGALGGRPLFHLSRLYDTEPDAFEGSKVVPDAGWTFVRSFVVDVRVIARKEAP